MPEPPESSTNSFADAIQRLNAGDEDAAVEVFNRYARKLVGLARSRLDSQVRRTVDPEDVVQSVFRSFFVRMADNQFDFLSWDSLWGLLIRLTLRKCGRRVQNLRAACRDVRREVSASPAADSSGNIWEAVTREPTPEEIAILTETLDQLMRGLNETDRQILTLRLQGSTHLEVSETVENISERKVYRVIAQVRKRLEQIQHAQAPPSDTTFTPACKNSLKNSGTDHIKR